MGDIDSPSHLRRFALTQSSMLRTIIPFALLSTAAANEGYCELDSTTAVEHAVQAALAIWASDKRCSGAIVAEAPVKCTEDVATSIEELSKMGTAVGSMIGTCGNLKLENHACAEAADAVFAATAGLTAAGAKIADHCAHIVPAQFDHEVLDTATLLGECTANAAGSLNSFFQAHNSIQNMKKQCDEESTGGCRAHALDVVAVLSDFGAYIADAYSDCNAYHEGKDEEPENEAAACAAAVLDGIADLSEMTELGMTMHKACSIKDSRLYFAGNKAASATSSSSLLALVAAISAAAVVSFIAGSRFAKARQQRDTALPGIEIE